MLDDLAQLPEIVVSVYCELDNVPSPDRSERSEPVSIPDGFELCITSFLMVLVMAMLRVDCVLREMKPGRIRVRRI